VSSAQDGFTLVEVLVVSLLSLVAVLAVLGTLDTAARTVPRDVEWTHAIAEGRTGMDRMVREVRHASVVHGATPNRIDFETTIGGVRRRVMYACDVAEVTGPLRRCVRVEAASGAVLPAPATGATVVARLQNGTAEDPTFTFTPDAISPRYVTARLLVPSTGERRDDGRPGHAVVLEDGAELRNRTLGG
jgi:prepilin-type N-terminal cleavage/methylation domain-containing protein